MGVQDVLAVALARKIGRELTVEVAREIVRDVVGMVHQREHNPIDIRQFEPRQCGSITLAVEYFEDILDELDVLHRMHFAETEKHRLQLPFAPDIAAGIADERRGSMIQFTARCEGKLAGHLRVYLGVSRHTGTRFASEDALYLRPEYRRGRHAIRLLEYSEDCLRQLGVYELRANSKMVNRADKLLEFVGFKPVSTELVKFLDH
jgi:GNAT superfamily N-acetyltransferase